MAVWRIGSGFSAVEREAYRAKLARRPRSFDESQETEMTGARGFHAERSSWRLGEEPPGPPMAGGVFERARSALEHYRFSDPDIVVGHFGPADLLTGGTLLVEICVLGVHYLCGVRVHDAGLVLEEGSTSWSFRYDTIQGHIERGAQRFEVSKDHHTGEVRFVITSRWKRGELPNWWSHAGFQPLVHFYRSLWLKRAAVRMRALATGGEVDGLAGRPLETAAALGALAGVRSTSAPLVLAAKALESGSRPSATPVERGWARPVVTLVLLAAALAEMVADKSPRMPSRLSAPALLGRVVSAGLAASLFALRSRRRVLGPVVVAALMAVTSATVATRMREAASVRGGRRASTALGLFEDVWVWAMGLALLRRHTERTFGDGFAGKS